MAAAPPTAAPERREPVVALSGFGFQHVAAAGRALWDVTLEVHAGEYVGVLGATGAGVTTLLMALDGVVPQLVRGATSGAIAVLGRDPSVVPVAEMARHVGLVFDDPELAASQPTVADEVAFGLENQGVPRREMDERIDAVLSAVGLAGFGARIPATLSGGELQRLAIACVLVTGPRLLVLDEPSANLDPAGRRAVYAVLRSLNRDHGVTVVVADRDVEAIAADASRVIVLDRGRVVADQRPITALGTPASLREHGVRSTPAAELAEALGLPAPVPLSTGAVAARLAARPGGEAVSGMHRPRVDAAPLVEVRDAVFRYPASDRDAVAGVSFSVGSGEVVGIVGANGSGKSTLSRLVSGLLRPQGGSVSVDGMRTSAHPARALAAHVGLVFQNPSHQLLAATVTDELALGPRALGLPRQEVGERVRELADELELDGLLGRHPLHLGRAERKLVALAAVLAMRPRVLVLDEPTTGADARLAAIVEAQVLRAAGRGSAVLVASHDMTFLGRVCSRLVVLDEGRLRADAPTRRVFADLELLAGSGLEPPGIARVAMAVTADGSGPWPPVSLEEAVQLLRPAGADAATPEQAS